DATPTVTGLFAGTYTVTATDENNCTATASVTITGALAPEINITVDQQLTEDAPESGQLSIAITGGTPPFDILWNNGSTADSLFNLTSGQYIATVTDASGCEVMDTAYLFVPACTGGKIWKDTNRDGCQDGGETGMAGVEMYLAGTDIWGNTVADTTTSALNGEYIFEPLAPGEYLISMNVPDGFTLSPPDACTDDFVDSDFDANGVATEVVVLVEGHCCLIIDGGLYDGCLNVYDPGTICCDQVLCGPGNVPAPITSGSPAAGAAQVEYRWIFSENNSVNAGGSGWKPVLDAFGNPVNATTLYPGALYVTTYFARCVRATTCTEWLVTDVVTIIVDDEASALIDEPGAICVGDEIQFSAAPNGPGASYLWNFGPTANPSFSNDPAPTVVYQQSGYPTVWLTVTNNGCTSTDRMLIAVSNDPVYCGTAIGTPGIFQNGQAPQQATFRIYPNPVSDQLTISWNADIGPVVMVEIRSLEGKLLQVLKTDAVQSRLQTDLHYLRPGLYMLRLQYGDGRQEVFKLVKK
ncbi:MAG TPA: T9SS type A sorting domain-containing protein, partial [Bacteroidetes bacterium]|nr:T9SS type A sorting domain-containing protein [Bacteroidota bacterium]